jgi:hypothetical protein
MTKKFIYVDEDSFYTESVGAYESADYISGTSGVGDANKPIKTDALGNINISFIPVSSIDHGSITGLGDDDHSQYLLATGTRDVTGIMQYDTSKTFTNPLDIVNKAYVDAVAAGLAVHGPVRLATTDELVCNYSNGSSGVGATLTNSSGTLSALEIDTISTVVGNRILVKNQPDVFENGIYEVTTVGSGAVAWVLTRTTDFDNNPGQEIHDGDFFFVGEGSVNLHASFVQTFPWTGSSIVGSTSIVFAQFSAPGVMTPGNGLNASGSTWYLDIDTLQDGTGTTITTSNKLAVDFAGTTKYTTFADMIADLDIQKAIPSGTTGNFVSIDANDDIADSGYSASSFSLTGHDHSGVYAPIVHSHTTGDITGLQEYIEDTVGVEMTTVEGDIDFTYSDSSGVIYGNIKADAVKDTMIDFGTGVGQVSAVDVPIADAGNYTTQNEVEGALQEIYGILSESAAESFTAGAGGVTKGDLVYISANNTVNKLDIDNAYYGIGLAMATTGAGSTVKVCQDDTILEGVLTTATAGDKYYWSWDGATGGITSVAPTGSGKYVWQVGVAKNAADLYIEVRTVKKNS